MHMRFLSAAYHRNGCSGAGFYAVRLRAHVDGAWRELGAVVFDEAEHVAVLDDQGRSWRCEDFEGPLRAFIRSPEGERMIWGDHARQLAANEA